MTDKQNQQPLTIERIMEAKRKLAAMHLPDETFQPPVQLPAKLYDRAKAAGIDMTGYVKAEGIPVD